MAQTEGLTQKVEGAGGFKIAVTGAKVMVNADILFTLSGPIQILTLMSVCVTANNATASTMQYQSVPTVGDPTTISGASASLASATAGTTALLTPTALSTAPTLATAAAGGVQLGPDLANRIIVKNGTIKVVVGVGSTTGTWKHILHYLPLDPNCVVN